MIDVTQNTGDSYAWPFSAYNPAYAIWATFYIFRVSMIEGGQLSQTYNCSNAQYGCFTPSSCSLTQQWYVMEAAYVSGTWGYTCSLGGNTHGYNYVSSILTGNGNDNYNYWTSYNGWDQPNPYSGFPNAANNNPYYANGCSATANQC